jgi:hypothetical protein
MAHTTRTGPSDELLRTASKLARDLTGLPAPRQAGFLRKLKKDDEFLHNLVQVQLRELASHKRAAQ